ncbi:MAG: hypothetical protein MJ184_12685 [Treponema sp.]|uniref:hypothetical protein n=1 Tax=Treponema sp. TaxID=166 RepID=UPI00298DB95E|nr:hypothetical protein [Treponema sp.]MCQ2602210.1 hypothetical protein [Treponema sp.]
MGKFSKKNKNEAGTAVAGAGIGASSGAFVGALIGGPIGAVIGGTIGAAVGGGIGASADIDDKKIRSKDYKKLK